MQRFGIPWCAIIEPTIEWTTPRKTQPGQRPDLVEVTDMATEERWNGYGSHALSCGIRSSLSLPLIVEDEARGALNLYAAEPNIFGEAQRRRRGLGGAVPSGSRVAVRLRARQRERRPDLLAPAGVRSAYSPSPR